MTKKILVVDDEVINLSLLGNFLMPLYSVIFSTTGTDALIRAVEQSPDLIILDVMMPEMDGFEVCQHLKVNNKTAHIPVVFLSALDSDNSIKLGYEVGAVDYIIKPFDPAAHFTKSI